MDLYNIPNDVGTAWRMDKFIEYHINGINDTNAPLRSWLDKRGATFGDRLWATLLYSTSYCLGTALFAYEALDYRTMTKNDLEQFWIKYKPHLIFQSDRRYVKNMNWFVPIVKEFMTRTKRNPEAYFNNLLKGVKDPKDVYAVLYKEIGSWSYYGRFSIILFLRTLIQIADIPMDFSKHYDWKQGATTTAGALLIGYKDEHIEPFLETGKTTPAMVRYLDRTLDSIQKILAEKYPEKDNSALYITSNLCSYFKLFKQTRYIGYYVDRGQGELIKLADSLPDSEKLWASIYKARKSCINPKYLGEIQGWGGVRSGRNGRFASSGVLDY